MSAELSWTWRFDGAIAPGSSPAPAFPTQADAESWLGEEWRSLLASGVEAVHLYEGERHVYGPMSLRPAD
jgi:hypothetical protein